MGRGRYVDDLRPAGLLHAAMVRCPHAHARVERIDTTSARGIAGVVGVYTLGDLPECRGSVPPPVPAPPGFAETSQPILADRIVDHAGQPIAVVVAESPYIASDAAEAVLAEYHPLPAAGEVAVALAPGAPVVLASSTDNVAGISTASLGDSHAAFARAHLTVEARLSMPRLAGVPIETRGMVVSPEAPDGRFTVWASTQSPYALRSAIASLLGLAEEKVRVIAADTGGGFGLKGHTYPEDLLIAAIARRLARPVKWTETRRESFLIASGDRGQRHESRMALDGDGRIVALETSFTRDQGAYLSLGEIIARNTINHLPGPYRVPNLEARARHVLTHTSLTGAYRGSGRPEAVFVTERLMDRAARRLGLDPAELRRRNLIRPDEMPYRTGLLYRDGTAIAYDPADYLRGFDTLLEAFGYDAWRRRQAERQRSGRPLGIGLAAYVQGTGVGPFEGADVRVDGQGAVHVFIGVSSQGQAHETTLAQIAAAELGVSPDEVHVVAGDTAVLPYGMGTGGSRVAAVSGPAVSRSARGVALKARRVAAELLECAAEDIVLSAGRAHVAGVPERGLALGQLSRAALSSKTLALDGSPGLQVCGYFTPETVTFAFGAQACALEVDQETGAVSVLRYVAVHDCGRPINPMVVEGQLHGGILQGIASALGEAMIYDAEGQLLTGSLMEYALPTAAEAPPLETRLLSFPSSRNELGIKGVGESGIVAPAACIANAVEDALASRGAEVSGIPLTPERVWAMLQGGRSRPG
jgi:carbon-monoxide dehydrogenase large subunit